MRERRETGKPDLFCSRLDQIIDLNHPLVKLARAIDWGFAEQHFENAAISAVRRRAAWRAQQRLLPVKLLPWQRYR